MTIKVSHGERPLALFYQEKQPWTADALCRGSATDLFFGSTEQPAILQRQEALRACRAVCKLCPVARECAEQAFVEEANAPHGRYGVRAGLTAGQRDAIYKGGGLRGRNPLRLWKTRPVSHNKATGSPSA